MTIAMIPLLHNRIPGTNSESYLKKPSLDYHRLPALEKISRNKPIVFNWPVGDSVYITKSRSYTIGQVDREGPSYVNQDRELSSKIRKKDFVVRPVDKKDHYIKRCVAVPGDTLEIKDRQIYINGEPGVNPSQMQFLNKIDKRPPGGMPKVKLEKWGIGDTKSDIAGTYGYYITDIQREKLKSVGVELSYHKVPNDGTKLFPYDPVITKGWTVDNYGPIWIPKAGTTIELTKETLPFYRRIIGVYENNELQVKGGQIIINGSPATSYTFKQDYYWAMGDNRHNSEDSRMWGFVPHDHIVGKPLFIWFSTKNARLFDGIRFKRMFKSANVD